MIIVGIDVQEAWCAFSYTIVCPRLIIQLPRTCALLMTAKGTYQLTSFKYYVLRIFTHGEDSLCHQVTRIPTISSFQRLA